MLMQVQKEGVISVRVPKRLKNELKELGIDYPEEVREYLEAKVRQKQMNVLLNKMKAARTRLEKKIGRTPAGADYIRQDREHGH